MGLRLQRRKEDTNIIQLKEAIRAELNSAQTSGLPDPSSSVTDHTTRTLEPVEIRRQ
jgi:hypothetical protein